MGVDASAYGVTIERAAPIAGRAYYEVVEVRHLTPAENRGNHHVFVDVDDEDGARLAGAVLALTWGQAAAWATIDKPAGEPGANFALWKGQVAALQVGEDDGVSDVVRGLSTAHADEPPEDGIKGNTLYHHSFYVRFLRRPGQPANDTPPPPTSDDGSAGGDRPGPPSATDAPEGYFGWIERDAAELRTAFYRLHLAVSAKPALAAPAAAGVRAVLEELR